MNGIKGMVRCGHGRLLPPARMTTLKAIKTVSPYLTAMTIDLVGLRSLHSHDVLIKDVLSHQKGNSEFLSWDRNSYPTQMFLHRAGQKSHFSIELVV